MPLIKERSLRRVNGARQGIVFAFRQMETATIATSSVVFFIADANYQILAIRYVHSTAGAGTFDIERLKGTEAAGAGTLLYTGAFDVPANNVPYDVLGDGLASDTLGADGQRRFELRTGQRLNWRRQAGAGGAMLLQVELLPTNTNLYSLESSKANELVM